MTNYFRGLTWLALIWICVPVFLVAVLFIGTGILTAPFELRDLVLSINGGNSLSEYLEANVVALLVSALLVVTLIAMIDSRQDARKKRVAGLICFAILIVFGVISYQNSLYAMQSLLNEPGSYAIMPAVVLLILSVALVLHSGSVQNIHGVVVSELRVKRAEALIGEEPT